MELWDVYDADRRRTGRTAARGAPLGPGEYHLVIHVCLFNAAGEMLIQQRQPFKQGWPDRWDFTVGGSVQAGEDSACAAMREAQEELGLALALRGVRPRLTVNFARGFDDIYVVEQEAALDALRLQYEEVQAVRWASKEQILDMIREGSFIPYQPALVELLFALRGSEGAFRNKP